MCFSPKSMNKYYSMYVMLLKFFKNRKHVKTEIKCVSVIYANKIPTSVSSYFIETVWQ